jgi:hypothetical protein
MPSSQALVTGPLAAVVERRRPPGALGQGGHLGDDLVDSRLGLLAGEPTAQGDPGLAFLQGEQGIALERFSIRRNIAGMGEVAGAFGG